MKRHNPSDTLMGFLGPGRRPHELAHYQTEQTQLILWCDDKLAAQAITKDKKPGLMRHNLVDTSISVLPEAPVQGARRRW